MNTQPTEQKTAQKKKGLPVWAIVLIVIVVLAAIGSVIGGTQSNDEQTTTNSGHGNIPAASSSESGNKNPSVETKLFTIGDSIQTRYFKITLKAYDPDYKDYDEVLPPDAGNKYIYFEFEYENTYNNDNQYSYSSGEFSCYADNTLVSSSFLVGGSGTSMGELSYGRKAKVTVAFEVPIDCKTIELEWNRLFEDTIKLKIQ